MPLNRFTNLQQTAAGYRQMADDTTDPKYKDAFLRLAADYERFAAEEVGQLQSNERQQRSS